MYQTSSIHPASTDRAAQNAQFTGYLAQSMAPVSRALMLVAALAYAAATCASALTSQSSIPLLERLSPILPLLLIVSVSQRVERRTPLVLLCLSCVALLEIGINLNGIGREGGLNWVLPGCLLVPVASCLIWPGKRDFVAAMALCMLGPMPMLFYGDMSVGQIVLFCVYLVIALAVSIVLHLFMARILRDQFRLEQQLREQTWRDDLTGLYSRNRFLDLTARILLDAHDGQPPVSLLYLDADHFKRLNDDHGHAVGDRVLIELAEVLRAQLREPDLIGRVGGEEFAVLLPGQAMSRALVVAERLREAVHAVRCPTGHLTVSLGLAQYRPADRGIESLLKRADQALRQAKQNGRDRVESAR